MALIDDLGLQPWLGTLPYGSYLQNPYLVSLIIILVFAILAKLLLLIFSKVLDRLASKTKTKVDDLIFENTKKPLFYLILAYGLKLSLLNLGAWPILTKAINSLMALVFIFILMRSFDIIIETWGVAFAKKTKTNIDEVLMPLFHKAGKVVFVLIALMWILRIWQIDIGPYLAGVGISGIVLGLALQDSLKNILGGITLLLDETFQVNDKIKLESGEVGTIHDIGLRSTKMITYDNEIIYIPNGYLANSKIQNYTRPNPKIRVSVNFGVEYGSEINNVKNVVLGVVKKIKDVLDEPAPAVLFLEMGDSSLNFTLKFWVANWNEAYGKKLEATEAIYNALNKAKIGIPFPTRTIYMKKEV